MKSENEIREKISEYMDRLSADRKAGRETYTRDLYCGIIDALLWVIGDDSGAPI